MEARGEDDASPINNLPSLRDTLGRARRLSDFPPHQGMVLGFVDPLVPVNDPIIEQMKTLQNRYAKDGILFVAVYADPNFSIPQVAAHATDADLGWYVLVDSKNELAASLNLVYLSTFCLLDAKNTILYRGELGKVSSTKEGKLESSNGLVSAIDQLVSGAKITPVKQDGNGRALETPQEDFSARPRTYEESIRPLFETHCQSCHRKDGIAPFALSNYREVTTKAKQIEAAVRDYRMPPWFADERFGQFTNDSHLQKQERKIILDWLASRKAQGNESRQDSSQFPGRWSVSKPDAVLEADKAIDIPEHGSLSTVRIELGQSGDLFKERRWIQSIECRPSNPGITRSITGMIVAAGQAPPEEKSSAAMASFMWFPGFSNITFPSGTAYRMEAGSRIFLDVTVLSQGTAAKEQPAVALSFAKEAPAEEVQVQTLSKNGLEFPSGETRLSANILSRVNTSCRLLGIVPLMNDWGYFYRLNVELPGDYEQVVLSIPRFDPNFPIGYWLAEPLLLPKASNIRIQGRFDRSLISLSKPTSAENTGEKSGGMLASCIYLAVPVGIEQASSEPLLKDISTGSESLAAGSFPEVRLQLIPSQGDRATLEPLNHPSGNSLRITVKKQIRESPEAFN